MAATTPTWTRLRWSINFVLLLLLGCTVFYGRSARAQTLAPEIVELARGLKNDPDLIYQYVYNNIETLPQFGSLKGAGGALVDGKGTPHDQAELMVAMLRQSGYSAGFVTGRILYDAGAFTSWLGTDNGLGSVEVTAASGGFDPILYPPPPFTANAVILKWAWVYADIGGTRYVFDPSSKRYTRTAGSGCVGLGSALGYARTTFLTNAESGATITPTSITSLNRSNIRDALSKYAGNLVAHLKANCPAASTQDVVGGKTIVPLSAGAVVRQTKLSYQDNDPDKKPEFKPSLPSDARTTLKLEFGSNDPSTNSFTSLSSAVTFNSSDIYGHRMVVSFNASAIPSLLIDGVVQMTANGTVPGGRRLTVRTSIVHPYPETIFDVADSDQVRVTPTPGALYVISTGWGFTSRAMIEKHRRVLLENIAMNPGNPASEAVLGESLAMLGYTWLAEHSQHMALLEQLAGVTSIYHHAVGVVGMKTVGRSTGPFIDLPMNTLSFIQRTNRPRPAASAPVVSTAQETAAVAAASVFSSVAESGSIEQTQPGSTAASTVKLIDLAIQSGGAVFDINNQQAGGNQADYVMLRPILAHSYLPADLARIDVSVASGNRRVIAPANGSITLEQFQGAGYYALLQEGNGIGAFISGGLSGGEPATPIPPEVVVDNAPYSVTPAPAQSPIVTSPIQSAGNAGGNVGYTPISWEPINLVTGDYLLTATDLAVGSQPIPYGLVFQRYYDSGTRFQRGALGPAWTHNFAITAQPNSDAFEGLASNSPINGASAIAALYVIFDILNAEGTNGKSLKSILVATVAQRWLMDQLTANVVAVAQPGVIEHFVKLADGSYNPPLGSAAGLTLDTGAYTYVSKDRTTLSFDTNGNLVTWRSAAGATITLTYAGSPARLVAVSNDFRRQLTLTYESDLLKQVQDDSGRSISYTYDASGNLVGYYDTLGNLTKYAYGAPGQLTSIINPSFPSVPFVTNVYDSLGRVMTQINAAGAAWQYFFGGTRSEEVDPKGMRHVLYTTPRGRTRLEIQDLDGLSLQTATDYDGLDRPTKRKLPAGNSISYEYDRNSNIIKTTRNDKSSLNPVKTLVTSAIYDPTFNKPVQIVDPRGLVTSLAYDATGNLLSLVANSAGSPKPRTRYTYTGDGLPLSVTDPVGTVTRYTYDEFANRLSTVEGDGTGPLSRTTTYTYNAWGDAVSITDPNGNITRAIFDLARRPTETTTPATAAAPGGIVTTNSYDTEGRLLRVRQSSAGALLRTASSTWTPTGKQASATDANGNVTTWAYDLLDRLARITDAEGRVTTYDYDNVSRPTATYSPAIQPTALVRRTYTPSGLMAKLTDANGNTTDFTYDDFDRLITISYPAAPPQPVTDERFTYDDSGNVLIRKTRAGDIITFTYDGLNRLITKSPPSSPSVTYGYDLTGRLIGVSDTSPTIPAAASPTGSSVTYVTTYTYDALNQPTGIIWNPAPAVSAPATGLLVTFGHTYDRTNRRIGQTANDNNWLAYPAGPHSTVTYTANALNQYATVTGLTPSYSANGNLTGDGTYTYGYDTENRLVSASGGGNTASYIYDGRGWRKSRTVNGTTTISVTDADNREVLEYDSTGAILRWYAYGVGPNEVLNQMNVSASTRFAFLPDIQGSTVATLSPTGVVAKSAYLPYGTSAAPASPFAYTGQRIEPETGGLYYYRARHYSPGLGRFLQTDPIGYAAGANLYAYTGNDALNNVDPDGLISLTEYAARGIRIINAALTGSVHPVTGIPFRNGFPDFSSVATRTVQLERITGKRGVDSEAANAAAGLGTTPSGYVWHHAESGIAGVSSTTMQLVPERLHAATAHTGPAAYARAVGDLVADIATDPTTYMSVGIGAFLNVMAPSPANANESEVLQQLRATSGVYNGAGVSMDFGTSKLK